MKKIVMQLTALFLLTLALTGCLGSTKEPGLTEGTDDSLIGRMAREIGTDEMDLLLHDPEDTVNPGLPINHMLYMIDRVTPDKMIRIVQQLGARKTLDLIYAIKRLGCNRPVPGYPMGKFNIPVDSHCDCTLEDYNYLDAMTSLVNGVNDVNQLISLVNRDSLVANPIIDPILLEEDNRRYMEKLAFIVVYLEDPGKMIALMNGVMDSRDVVYFIDQFDPGIVPPVSTPDIVNDIQLGGIKTVVNIMKSIGDTGKMYHLINGARTQSGFSGDPDQIEYIRDKLIPVINGGADPKDRWVSKLVCLMDRINRADRMTTLLCLLTPAAIPNIVDVLTGCYAPGDTAPANNSIPSLAYEVDNISDPGKMAYLVTQITPANLSWLINEVSTGSQTADDGQPDLMAGARKMVNVIEGADDSTDLVFLLNGVSNFSKMGDLLNTLKIASTAKVSHVLNDITGPNSWNPASPGTATGVGKLVNMVDNISNLSVTAQLIEEITEEDKLSALINQVDNSTYLTGLINVVIAHPWTGISDMSSMLNLLPLSEIPKLSLILTELGGTKNALMADLMSPYAADSSRGIGYPDMADLIIRLNGTVPAGKLGQVIRSLGGTMKYRGGNIPAREGMVRLLRGGVLYSGRIFPGLGTPYLAVMMNGADDPADLSLLLNGTDLDQIVPIIGCGERIASPDFHTPCTACGMGW